MSFREFPVWVPMGSERLCAIVCAPEEDEIQDLGVVLLTGGNYTRSHRNSMWVRAARELAAKGFASIRIDYHGVGDSTGTAIFDMEAPFDEDALAAERFLRRAIGASRTVMVATCFGGRSAMSAAARSPETVSVTIFPVPLLVPHHTEQAGLRSRVGRIMRRNRVLRRVMRRPAARRMRQKAATNRRERSDQVSPKFKRDLGRFLEQGDARFVYGELDDTLPDLQRCLRSIDHHLRPRQRDRIHVEVVPGQELHRFQSLETQDLVVGRAVASVEETYEALVGAARTA